MANYIIADLKRISVRIPRLIALAAVYAVLVLLIFLSDRSALTSVTFVLFVGQYISYLPVILGTLALLAVYGDDFKARTMQVAIGIGITRSKVVICKLIEMMIVVLIDIFVLTAVVGISAAVLDMALTGEQVMEITAQLFTMWISIIAYSSLAMILLFFTQAAGIAVLLYIALSAKIVSSIVAFPLEIDALLRFHLNRYLLTPFLMRFKTHLVLGSFDVPTFLGVVVYIVAGVGIAIALFRKRELEF